MVIDHLLAGMILQVRGSQVLGGPWKSHWFMDSFTTKKNGSQLHRLQLLIQPRNARCHARRDACLLVEMGRKTEEMAGNLLAPLVFGAWWLWIRVFGFKWSLPRIPLNILGLGRIARHTSLALEMSNEKIPGCLVYRVVILPSCIGIIINHYL